jgi:putative peptidoglycan lipid II flippase
VSRRIGMAGLIWTVALLASRVIGLVRESVLGATLGVSSAADVYAAAFRVPDLFGYVVSGGALSIIFVPMFAGHVQRGDEDRAWRAFSVVSNFVVLLLLVGGGAVWLAMPSLAAWMAPGFTPEDTALLVRLSRIVLPAQLFHILGGLLSAVLLARDKHAVPALAPLVYTLCVIAGGLVSGSAEGFAWGVVVGGALGVFGLPLYACIRGGVRWQPVLSLTDPDFRHYIGQSLPVMLGFSIVSVDDAAWTWFGSELGEGSVAVLNYAKTLMKVPMGVFGVAMGMAAYPTIARLVADGKQGEAWGTLTSAARRALVLAFASQVALTVAGPELATLVLGTGRIPAARMEELGACLGAFSLALGAWTAQTLIARGFYARGEAWLPTWLGFGVLIVSLPLYGWLGGAFGAVGLAGASSAGMLLYVGVLTVLLRRRMAQPGAFGGFLLRIVPVTAAVIAAGLLARHGLGPMAGSRVDAAYRIAVLAGVCGPLWLIAAWWAGVGEVVEVGRGIVRRLNRVRGGSRA